MGTSGRKKTTLLVLSVMLLCFQGVLKAQDSPYQEIPIGVIMDMRSWIGKTAHSCITMAISDFYAVNNNYKTRVVLHDRDTHGEPMHALSAALDLLENHKVQAIIGAESPDEAKFLAVLGDQARVPIFSLSPSPFPSEHLYFIQIAQDETTQFQGIAAMAESFKWKNVIIICEDTDNGREMAEHMTNVFQEKGMHIAYRSSISPSASNELVLEELHKLSNVQTKIFVMHTSPALASHLLVKAKNLGLTGEGYKWILTSKIMNFMDFMNVEVIESMQGAVGFRSYIPESRELRIFASKWRKKFHGRNHTMEIKDVNAYGIWAYDAVSALALAVERIQAEEQVQNVNMKGLAKVGSTHRGTEVLDQILRISFQGLGGVFQLMNRRITAKVLEITNVIDKGERKVGLWTANAAFTRNNGNLNPFADDSLEAIIWPRGTTTNLKHRMLEMSVKRLRIGIPVASRSGNFFEVAADPQTNAIRVSGFCVDVFEEAVNALNHSLPYEFIPFEHAAKVGTVNYNDLIDQVHNGLFDVAIGDITITANRSLYVDFTLPYTDIGIGMLCRDAADRSMWIFFRPLSNDLWFATACFFILLGFVVWIIEHRTNEEFQGSPSQQIGKTLWFAFSTLVYAHREKLQSNMSRFVVIVWLFVVVVLTSSYTAMLSSLLTVQQLQIASKGDSIGYRIGFPIQGVTVSNLNFTDTKLKPYSSYVDYANALSKGTKNGGVGAIVDEIPYIKEFLSEYPSGYSMVSSEPTTNGFGFVFPKGSPLAPEMSSQIARLREDGTLKLLERRWFDRQLDLTAQDSVPSPEILNLNAFRGLFLISGVSMALALFVSMVYLFREKMHVNYQRTGGVNLPLMKFVLRNTANAVEERSPSTIMRYNHLNNVVHHFIPSRVGSAIYIPR